jgi:hypothetical protein
MPVLGGTKTITRDEIIDPEPNVKEIFFAQLILRQAPRRQEFRKRPRLFVLWPSHAMWD